MSNPSKPNVAGAVPFDQVADPTKYVYFWDDFIAGDVALAADAVGGLGGWIVKQVAGDSAGTLAAHTTAADLKGHPGVVVLSSGTTTLAAADEMSLGLQNADVFVLYDPSDATARSDEHIQVTGIFKFPAITDAEIRFGLFDDVDAAGRGVNSVCVEYDESADAEFNLVVVDGSSATAVATTIAAAADTWYRFDIFANEDEVQLFINGAFAAVATGANIPDDEPLTIAVKLAIEGTAEKTVLIDGMGFKIPVDR